MVTNVMIQSTIPTRVNGKARSMKGKPRRNPRGLQSSSHILLLNFSSLSVKIHCERHFVIDPNSPSAASRPARICKTWDKFKTKSLPKSSSLRLHRSSSSSDTTDGNTQNSSRSSCITVRNGQGYSGSSYITVRNRLTWRLCGKSFFYRQKFTETLQLHYKSGILRMAPVAFESGIVRIARPPVTLHSGMVDWKCLCQELFTDAFLLQQTEKERKGSEMKKEQEKLNIWTSNFFWTFEHQISYKCWIIFQCWATGNVIKK